LHKKDSITKPILTIEEKKEMKGHSLGASPAAVPSKQRSLAKPVSDLVLDFPELSPATPVSGQP
jgi:hypothetical protein